MRSSQARPTAKPARILLVASHTTGLKARKTLLEEKGYEVIASSKTKDASAHLQGEEFSLVIADYKLDHGNGLEFLRAAKDGSKNRPTILLVTPVEELSLDSDQPCADHVVSKKANEVAELLRCVERLIVRKTPRKKPSAIRKPRRNDASASG